MEPVLPIAWFLLYGIPLNKQVIIPSPPLFEESFWCDLPIGVNCKDLPHPEMIAMVFLFPVQDSQLIESESRIKQKEARGPGPRRLPLEPSRFGALAIHLFPAKW